MATNSAKGCPSCFGSQLLQLTSSKSVYLGVPEFFISLRAMLLYQGYELEKQFGDRYRFPVGHFYAIHFPIHLSKVRKFDARPFKLEAEKNVS